MLALIAEVDRRKAFRDEGYSSMYRYCVEKLCMSEDVAYKRILTARASRRFPAILPAIANGRLSISTVALLRNHLDAARAGELLNAAAGRTRSEVELLIAQWFPKNDVPTTVHLLPAPEVSLAAVQNDVLILSDAPAQVVANMEGLPVPGRVTNSSETAGPVPATTAPTPPTAPAPQHRVAPLSPGRFELRLTISQKLHDKIRRAQELLGHAVPSGDIPQLLERALDELIARQETRQFAATDMPRKARGSRNPRYIPAPTRRAVWNRDGGQCSYVSDRGHRCEARNLLQYDHVIPVARGGSSTVDNVRLRCRAHNQLEAERLFGARFMEDKRGPNASAAN
jgi:5-methylcytosine-specific restriction endonuclease McrA